MKKISWLKSRPGRRRSWELPLWGLQGRTKLFVSLLQALMSLFVLSSKDGWVNIMYDGLDAVGIDQQVPVLQSPLLSHLGIPGVLKSQQGAELWNLLEVLMSH